MGYSRLVPRCSQLWGQTVPISVWKSCRSELSELWVIIDMENFWLEWKCSKHIMLSICRFTDLNTSLAILGVKILQCLFKIISVVDAGIEMWWISACVVQESQPQEENELLNYSGTCGINHVRDGYFTASSTTDVILRGEIIDLPSRHLQPFFFSSANK